MIITIIIIAIIIFAIAEWQMRDKTMEEKSEAPPIPKETEIKKETIVVKTSLKSLQKSIEKELKCLMESLKPKIKEKVLWGFSDKIIGKNGEEYKTFSDVVGEEIRRADIIKTPPIMGGDMYSGTARDILKDPVMITFYTKVISELYNKAINNDLKMLIRHEIGHIFDIKGVSDKTGEFENDKFNIFNS